MKTVRTSVVLLFLTIGVIPKATAAELTRVRVGILATGEFCQTYIAQKKGFFAKNGLDVELIYFQGGSQVIQAMLGGELPLTVTAGPEGCDRQTSGRRYRAALRQ